MGDDDQSIYGWRGATLDNLRRLPLDYPALKVIKLEQNYRSTSAILRAANNVIGPNPKLFPKTLFSELGEGEPVRVVDCDSEEHEAERAELKAAAPKDLDTALDALETQWNLGEGDRKQRYVGHALGIAAQALDHVGLPAIIRPSFTMGGAGSGMAYNEDDLRRIAGAGLQASPTTEILLEESILGWKEYELELMRDHRGDLVIESPRLAVGLCRDDERTTDQHRHVATLGVRRHQAGDHVGLEFLEQPLIIDPNVDSSGHDDIEQVAADRSANPRVRCLPGLLVVDLDPIGLVGREARGNEHSSHRAKVDDS